MALRMARDGNRTWRSHKGCHARNTRQQRWTGLERLEERVVLSNGGDLVMLGATAASPTVIAAEYQITGMTLPAPVTVGIYRSADPVFDASDLLVGQTILSGAALEVGTHFVLVGLTESLEIDPSQRFVLAVADPDNDIVESNEENNTASFRKWVVGAVTHGLETEPFGGFPEWVNVMATSLLEDAGYDAAIPFDWAEWSAIPELGLTTLVAEGLAFQIGQVIAGLPLAAGDVVDVHLIGHSRGGSVVSQTAGLLPSDSPPLQGGFLKLTLLDPHPARNADVPYFSHSTGPLGEFAAKLFVAFQDLANDPPLTIPPNADRTEIFFQQTPAPEAIDPLEKFLISWGEVPAGGATDSVMYYNVTELTRSHFGVHAFYQQVVVPTLGADAPVPVPPVPTPEPPTHGGPAFPNRQLGTRFEFELLQAAGIPHGVAVHLLRGFDVLNRHLDQGRFRAAEAQINRLTRFIQRRTDRGIPAPIAENLLAGLSQARFLLLPPSTVPAAAPASAGARK